MMIDRYMFSMASSCLLSCESTAQRFRYVSASEVELFRLSLYILCIYENIYIYISKYIYILVILPQFYLECLLQIGMCQLCLTTLPIQTTKVIHGDDL